jgi:hypothetical protein
MSYIFNHPLSNGVSSKDLRKARRFAKSVKSTSGNTCKDESGRSHTKKSRLSLEDTNSNIPRPGEVQSTVAKKETVDHPLTFPTLKLPFDRDSPLANFFTSNGWNSASICRVPHSTGYQAESAMNQIASVPADIRSTIGQVLLTIQEVNRNSNPDLLRAKLGVWMSVTSMSDIEHESTSRLLEDDEMLWEIDPGTGYQVISVSYETQLRRKVVINGGLARMFGMHKEEMVNRLANYDLYLPYIEIDSLMVFLYTLLQHPMPGRRVKYLRMFLGGRFMLVCWCTAVIADAMGRVIEVS